MAVAGAAHGHDGAADRADLRIACSNPRRRRPLSLLHRSRSFTTRFYLNRSVPGVLHNAWTMVAFAIIGVFLIKGVCDYLGNYLINYAGFSAVTDLRNAVFDKVSAQGAEFFEAHSTGQLMSSIMNDIDKIQVATSQILADFLRQIFAALGLLFVVIGKDWKLALVSLTVLPFVMLPDHAHRPPHPPHQPPHAGSAGAN